MPAPGVIHAEARFPRPAADSVVLAIPPWAGVTDFIRDVELSASRDGRPLESVRTGDSWVVRGTTDAFTVHWSVPAERDSFIGRTRADAFRPIMQQDWGFAWGRGWVLQTSDSVLRTLHVTLATDRGSYSTIRFSKPTDVGSLNALASSLLLVGDFREVRDSIGSLELVYLIRGSDWSFPDSALVGAVGDIARAFADAMRFAPRERQWVVLVEGSASSSGGTVEGGALALYPNPEDSLRGGSYGTLRLIAHELFHLWNGNASRMASERGEGYLKWFQEGLTEYYAYAALLRTGMVRSAEFVERLNAVIREYEGNPARQATAADLEVRYWSDPAHQRLPYLKGVLLGLWLETQLASAGHSLDDAMRTILSRPTYDEESVRAALVGLGGPDMERWLAAYAEGGRPLMAALCAETPLECESRTLPMFDFGFRTHTGTLVGESAVIEVTPDSPAARAGIALGDTLTGRVSYYHGDATRDAMVEVRRAGNVRRVTFRPAVEREILLLAPTAATLRTVEALVPSRTGFLLAPTTPRG